MWPSLAWGFLALEETKILKDKLQVPSWESKGTPNATPPEIRPYQWIIKGWWWLITIILQCFGNNKLKRIVTKSSDQITMFSGLGSPRIWKALFPFVLCANAVAPASWMQFRVWDPGFSESYAADSGSTKFHPPDAGSSRHHQRWHEINIFNTSGSTRTYLNFVCWRTTTNQHPGWGRYDPTFDRSWVVVCNQSSEITILLDWDRDGETISPVYWIWKGLNSDKLGPGPPWSSEMEWYGATVPYKWPKTIGSMGYKPYKWSYFTLLKLVGGPPCRCG